jgi:lysozyme
MTVNAKTIDLICEFEGWVDHWYADPAHGWAVPTCCYGHTDAAGPPLYADDKKRTFTVEEGRSILAKDLASVEAMVRAAVTVPVTEDEIGALVSFTFNLGEGNFKKSTLLRKLNAGASRSEVAAEFARWNRAGGKVMAGLTRRRAAEAALFLTPDGSAAPETPAPVTVTPPKPTWFWWAIGALVLVMALAVIVTTVRF